MKKILIFLLIATAVSAATLEEAKDAYLNATLDIAQVKNAGFGYKSLEDALSQMDLALNGRNASRLLETALLLNQSPEGKPLASQYFAMIEEARRQNLTPGQNFSFVIERAGWIATAKDQAFFLHDAFLGMQKEIALLNASVNVTVAESWMQKANDDFVSERYSDVSADLNQTRIQLEDAKVEAARERAFVRLARRNVVNYVQDHWRTLLLEAVIALCILSWLFLEIRALVHYNRMKRLELALREANEVLVEVQKAYYGGGTGSATYHVQMDHAREKLRVTKGKLMVAREFFRKYRAQTVLVRLRYS